ncbi:MAG: PspA/IM30 family protein [Gammaproteobacteria bacterium]|nr:PspA/IM30 family protein [Gammaproteobacteria bacterium]
MPLLSRLSRLFQADFHAVLDQLEEPEALLRQSVREMEDALAADERVLKRLGEDRQRAARQHADCLLTLERLELELATCFAEGETELARRLVRRKLEQTKLAASLLRAEDDCRTRAAALAARLEENRARLANLRHKLDVLASQAVADDRTAPRRDAGPDLAVADDEVEAAFLREQAARKPS